MWKLHADSLVTLLEIAGNASENSERVSNLASQRGHRQQVEEIQTSLKKLRDYSGIAVDPALSDQAKARVQHNTELFALLGADSVPLIVFKNAKTGVFGSHSGAVDTAELAAMAGV